MLETRQLRHVEALGRLGTFAQAAEALAITQPALTKSIQKLEDQLGLRLFERTTRRVRPTVFGEALIERARRVLRETAEIERHLAALRDIETGNLSVGAGPFAAESVASPALGLLMAQHPGLTVSLRIDSWRALHTALAEAQIDLFVAERGDLDSLEDFAWMPLPPVPVLLFCRAGHPLLDAEQLSPAALAAYPWVTPQSTPHFEALRDLAFAARSDGTARPGIVSENLMVNRHIVASSDLIGVGPLPSIADDLARGTLATLPVDLALSTNYGIVHRRGISLSPAAEAFIDCLKKVGAR